MRNPVDVGLVLGGAAEMYCRTVEATIVDPGVDALVVIAGFGRGDGWDTHDNAMAEMSRATGKPILRVSFGPADPALERALAREGSSSFPSAERALRAYARVCWQDG